MRKRTFHYIYDEQYVKADDAQSGTTRDTFTFKMKDIECNTEDLVSEEMVLLVFPIKCLFHIDSVLRMFNLKDDVFNFFQQCKDVIAVPENHQDDKGNGKMNFQSFFYNVPYSMHAANPDALIIVGLDPVENTQGKPREYHLSGYMHLNQIEFKPDPLHDKLEKSFYFNLLRISERTENGVEVYRRKKLFSLFFSISHTMCAYNNINYIYASMGKENVKIKEALHRSSEVFNVAYERLPFKIFGKINFFSGSKNNAKKLVDITDNISLLKEFYEKMDDKMSNFLFYPHLSFEQFHDFVKTLTAYSKTSRVWMVKDEKGNMAAATFAMNWGDFFAFLMQNPKGLLKIIAGLKITEKILYFMGSVGDPQHYRILQSGLISHYRNNHGVQLTFLPSYEGDPFYNAKKSIISDDYVYFVMSHKPDDLQRFKANSADSLGNPRLFIDVPVI